MSLRPQPLLPPVPDDIARVARAAFRRSNSGLPLPDQLGSCVTSLGQGRQLTLPAREQRKALATARARQETKRGQRLYAQRQGVKATISQSVRSFGPRQARTRGVAKMGLQSVATAAALNLDRLAAWFAKRPLAPTRRSRFAAMAA